MFVPVRKDSQTSTVKTLVISAAVARAIFLIFHFNLPRGPRGFMTSMFRRFSGTQPIIAQIRGPACDHHHGPRHGAEHAHKGTFMGKNLANTCTRDCYKYQIKGSYKLCADRDAYEKFSVCYVLRALTLLANDWRTNLGNSFNSAAARESDLP